MAWTQEARDTAAATRKAKAKHPAEGAKVAKAISSMTAVKGLNGLYPKKDVASWSKAHLSKLRSYAKTYK